MPDYKQTLACPQNAVLYSVNGCSALPNVASAMEVFVDEMVAGPILLTTTRFSDFCSSPRFRADYLEALKVLSDRLLEIWSIVLPERALVPLKPVSIFFEPFAQFGVTLYDKCAQMLLHSVDSEACYLDALNNDLKTLVYEQICPYRENPIKTFQDAIDADRRGEWPGEWAVRMAEAWRLFDHPRHDSNHERVRREFLDLDGPGLWMQLNDGIQRAISKRTLHWLKKYSEIVAEAAEGSIPASTVIRGAAGDSTQTRRPATDENCDGKEATRGDSVVRDTNTAAATGNEESSTDAPSACEVTDERSLVSKGIEPPAERLAGTDDQHRSSRKGDATLLDGKKLVTFKTAEEYLGISARQRQALMKQMTLSVEGKGQNRKISVDSLLAYLPAENTK